MQVAVRYNIVKSGFASNWQLRAPIQLMFPVRHQSCATYAPHSTHQGIWLMKLHHPFEDSP
jgi:hypothetical protein